MSTAEIIPLHQEAELSLEELVGSNIRRWRNYRSLSGSQLAKKIGTTRATISRLELGEQAITVTWIEKICAALNVRPEALFQEGEGK